MATENKDDQKKKAALGAAGGTSGAGLLAGEAAPQGPQDAAMELAPKAPNVTQRDAEVVGRNVGPTAPIEAAKDPDAFSARAQKDAEYLGGRGDTELQRMSPEFKAMRGMFEGGAMPEMEKAALDASTQGLIAGQEGRANADLKSIVAEQLAGTEYGKEALSKAMEGQKFSEQGLGGDQANFLEAIQKRAGRDFEGDMVKMKRRAELSAPEEKFNRLQQVIQTKQKQAFNQKMLADAEYKHKRNVQAAKNKMLGSVLGLGGMAIGGAMGGAPGASAGSQASGLAGNQEMENM